MSKYNIADLVWIPDGTINYDKQETYGVTHYPPIKGPLWGLVLDACCLDGETRHSEKHWLSVRVQDKVCIVHKKDVRKINTKEKIYD